MRPDAFTAVKVRFGDLCFKTPSSLADGTGVSEVHIAPDIALTMLHAVRSSLLRRSVLKPVFSLKCTPV
jgi:hypothetical protein